MRSKKIYVMIKLSFSLVGSPTNIPNSDYSSLGSLTAHISILLIRAPILTQYFITFHIGYPTESFDPSFAKALSPISFFNWGPHMQRRVLRSLWRRRKLGLR